MLFGRKNAEMPDPADALPGRSESMPVQAAHLLTGNPLAGPFPEGLQTAMFGMGCFWGAERKFWVVDGVYTTAVGYAGGYTPNASYEEVCSGRTGHNEVVLIVFDPSVVSYEQLLKVFWDNHDPTQGMRQGNDVGTQYRSGIYTYDDDQAALAKQTQERFQAVLDAKNYGTITTEIVPAPEFYYAEEYHQQYLHRNPNGYCGLGGTGMSCPIGLAEA